MITSIVSFWESLEHTVGPHLLPLKGKGKEFSLINYPGFELIIDGST